MESAAAVHRGVGRDSLKHDPADRPDGQVSYHGRGDRSGRKREASLRRDKRLSKRLQYAKLRQQACVEDIDYRTPRGLDRCLLTMLVEGQWIDDHANLLICGPTGLVT